MLHGTGRQPVYARNVVATSQPLAAQAGLSALRRGGNAVDAAVAAASCLTVVEPTSNGLGGDLFAIVRGADGTVHGLNASGRSPAAWTGDRFAGVDSMPQFGGDSVTVPGCVAGWRDLIERFGSMSLGDVLEPAIRYATDGHPVGPITAAAWARAAVKFGDRNGFRETFCPAPAAGEIWNAPGHARTLRRVADDGGESFYRGEIAQDIAAAVRADGGALTADDLAAHENEWVEPLSVDALGFTLLELPPNGQGIAASMALQLCDALDAADDPHRQVEAMKLAFADLHAHVADPAAMRFPPRLLLDPAYAADRAALVGESAGDYGPGEPSRGGTVYLCAADAGGMMVSLIQSNYFGFGSGVVAPRWGVALQNRGFGFVTTGGHPNAVGPRKRPFHTIIPGLTTAPHDLVFGVMGGPMQAQGHLQLLLRLRAGEGLQRAVDAPRWQLARAADGRWQLWHEAGYDAAVLSDLRRRGHALREMPWEHFGGAQAVRRLAGGVYEAASDPRKDGGAAGF